MSTELTARPSGQPVAPSMVLRPEEIERFDRQGPAREAGSRAPGDERNTFIVAELDYLLDVCAGLGEDDEVGDNAVVHQAVALVGA